MYINKCVITDLIIVERCTDPLCAKHSTCPSLPVGAACQAKSLSSTKQRSDAVIYTSKHSSAPSSHVEIRTDHLLCTPRYHVTAAGPASFLFGFPDALRSLKPRKAALLLF